MCWSLDQYKIILCHCCYHDTQVEVLMTTMSLHRSSSSPPASWSSRWSAACERRAPSSSRGWWCGCCRSCGHLSWTCCSRQRWWLCSTHWPRGCPNMPQHWSRQGCCLSYGSVSVAEGCFKMSMSRGMIMIAIRYSYWGNTHAKNNQIHILFFTHITCIKELDSIPYLPWQFFYY